jgi:hypothetical protein
LKSIFGSFFLLLALTPAWSYGPDFINNYVQNSKLLYGNNGYEVVQEKTFDISDLGQGNNRIAYVLDPGEYFVQLVTEPCFKLNVEVKVSTMEGELGVVSEKPEMRAAIAIFDVPEPLGKLAHFTEIKLNGPIPAYCSNAKARILVYKHISD